MCGFAGYLNFSSNQNSCRSILTMMGKSINHRGPDDSGIWLDSEKKIGLAHQRLSIIDLSDNASQPMISNSKRYVLVFNGEIYNFLKIKEKLISKGYSFKSSSDTEVLLALFDIYGVEPALNYLDGMFAFAVWDNIDNNLIIARDRIGEKPIYYYLKDNILVFASELKAIEKHPSFKKEIDLFSLEQYVKYSYVPSPYCIYKFTKKLNPAEIIKFEIKKNTILKNSQQWWNYSKNYQIQKNVIHNFDDNLHINECEKILANVVKKQMISDAPIGSFLSGGIDSSLITLLMQNNSNKKIKTFTIGYDNHRYNESVDARKIADYLGTDHHEMIVTHSHTMDTILKIPSIYDEPFADHSQIPSIILSEYTSQYVKVALSGDGGDEVFGGYNRYQWAPKISKLNNISPYFLRSILKRILLKISPKKWDSIFSYLSNIIPDSLNVRQPGEKIHKIANILECKNDDEIYSTLTTFWNSSVLLHSKNNDNKVNVFSSSLEDLTFIEKMMTHDISTYLPDDIFVKMDRASMSSSLETRSPFVDREVLSYSQLLPNHLKMNNGVSKWILKKILEKHIPITLFNRPKTGFGIPIHEWLRGPLRNWTEELLSKKRIDNDGYFDSGIIRKKWDQHLSGKFNNQYLIWSILMFNSWHDEKF